jgi:hypothetical protein
MPDKVNLISFDIDTDKALKDAVKLKEEITKLKERLDTLKKSNQENSSAFIKYSAELKANQSELRTQENLIAKVTQANNITLGTIPKLEAANAKLRNEQRSLNLETKEGKKRNEEINKQINKNTETISKNSDKRKQNTLNIGNYTSSLGSSGVAINAATSAAKTFGTVLKIALGPIGLIIAAIASLTAYFKRSEEGQDSFNKAIKVFQVVLNNVLDVIGKVGEALFKAVENPKQAWQDFKNFIKGIGEFFKDTFGNVIGGSIEIFVGFLQKAFANIGLAWQKLKGIFVDNSEKINKAQAKIDEFNKKIQDGQDRVKEGAENLGNGIKDAFNKAKTALQGFISEQQKEIDIAKRLADQQAALDRQIRKNRVEEAKSRRDLEKLKGEIEKKDKLTAQERINLLDEENKIYDRIKENNLNILRQKYNIKKAQNSLSASTKEDLDEESQLLADIYNLEASITSQRKEAITKRLEVQREAAGESVKQLETELELYKQNNKYKLEDLKEIFNREKAILDEQLKGKLILENDYNLKLAQLKDEYADLERDRELERIQADYENQLELAEGQIFKTLELERQGLELKRQQEIEAAEKIGADTKIIYEKYEKAKTEIKKAEEEARLLLASGFASNVASLLGEQTALGKLAAIANTTISTYASAQGAFQSFVSPPIAGPLSVPLGIAAAAAAVASGIANVKKILAVKSGLPGDSGGKGGASISASTGGGATSAVANVNPQIGQGIVSRQTTKQTIKQAQQEYQKILVTDDVTANQMIKSKQNKIAAL